jgi:hypothetical protein
MIKPPRYFVITDTLPTNDLTRDTYWKWPKNRDPGVVWGGGFQNILLYIKLFLVQRQNLSYLKIKRLVIVLVIIYSKLFYLQSNKYWRDYFYIFE